VKVVQESLRYANARITMEPYAQALTPDKRNAQSKVIRMILPQQTRLSSDRKRRDDGTGQEIPSLFLGVSPHPSILIVAVRPGASGRKSLRLSPREAHHCGFRTPPENGGDLLCGRVSSINRRQCFEQGFREFKNSALHERLAQPSVRDQLLEVFRRDSFRGVLIPDPMAISL